MGKRLQEHEWAIAERMWLSGDYTKKEIADAFGISEYTVVENRKKREWAPKGSQPGLSAPATPPPAADPPTETDTATAPADLNIEVDDQNLSRIEAELAQLRADNARLTEENARYKPTADIRDILADPVAHLESVFGAGYWRERAEGSFAAENRTRMREGLRPLDPDVATLTEIEERMKATKREALAPGRPIVEPPRKTVKMLIHRPMEFRGRVVKFPVIEQIPLEPQINNTAGSLADGIVRYTDKGFKITDPFLCLRGGCYTPAAVSRGEWEHDGYCSRAHRVEVEGTRENADLPNVVTAGAAR